jgi:DNA-binding response OmpR family regulator
MPLILLVDDFEDSLDIYAPYLTHHGHRVLVARTGHEALESARAHRPDIILLDVSMPGLNGLDVVRILRADQQFATRPIVALTARALDSERLEALKAGFDEVIAKPCLPDELVSSVRRILGAAAAKPRVLLATPLEDHIVTYEAALLRHGFVIQSTRTGTEALDIARSFRPTCAVVDLRLPDLSGWDVCRSLKAEPDTADIRIIVLTQELSPETITRGQRIDCHAWLTRPTAAEHLVETVRHVLASADNVPRSLEQALLGAATCPACQTGDVIAGVRVSAIQYYCCRRCRFCWRAEPLGSA